MDEQKKNDPDLVFTNLANTFGKDFVKNASELVTKETISTGYKEIDDIVGGGIPRGIVVELFGPEASGKGVLSMHICAEAQKQDLRAVWIDAENQANKPWMILNGIDVEKMKIISPLLLSAEQVLQSMEDIIVARAAQIIVVDSLPALVPQAEIDKPMGEGQVGIMGAIMSKALRKLTPVAAKYKCTIIFINQIREKIGIMFGCFHYNARVILEDGSTMKIGKIVNNKMKVKVLSYNPKTGIIEPKQIMDWHNNGNLKEDEAFLQIVAEKFGGNGRTNIPCTPNHIIFKNKGYLENEKRFLSEEVEAKDLDVGDEILIAQPIYLNHDQLQVVYGSILGDGSLRKLKEGCTQLRIGHGFEQKEYAIWKKEIISNVVSYVGDGKNKYSFDTIPMYELNRLNYKTKYGKNKFCHIPEEIINNLDILGLTIWYLDDGNFSGSYKKYGNGKSNICCTKFINKVSMLKVFHRLGLYPKLNNVGFIFDSENTEKFHSMICKFVPPSMEYKIHPKFRGGEKYIIEDFSEKENISYQSIPAKIIDIYEKPETRTSRKFDLTIEDNSTYLIDGAIVHNSPETTPGGKSLGHYASLRIRMQKTSDKIERNKEQIGLESKVKVVKSRFGMPGREAILPIYFEDYDPTPLEIMLDFIRRSSVIKFKKSLNTFLFDKLAGETIKDVLIAIHSNGRMEEFAKRFIEAANKKNIKYDESPEVVALLETMQKNEFSIEAFNT